MNIEWAKRKLEDYVYAFDQVDWNEDWDVYPLMRRLPTVRSVLDAIGENSGFAGSYDDFSTYRQVKGMAVRALGILDDREEIRHQLRPDSPSLIADSFHQWVWEAARPSWESGLFRAAVHHAASALNEQLQRKVGRQDISDDKLVQEAFSTNSASTGSPRLRVRGNPTSQTTQSRQRGALSLGQGCFWSIRNPAAHETSEWSEQQSLEYLATLSVLARAIDECQVETGS